MSEEMKEHQETVQTDTKKRSGFGGEIKEEEIKKYFLLSAAALFLSAVSVLLLPVSRTKTQELNVAGYLLGVLFWTGLIGGIVIYQMLFRRMQDRFPKEAAAAKRPSFACFFMGKPGKIADGLLIFAIAGNMICLIQEKANRTVELMFVFLCIVSVYLHVLVNGRIFQYLYKFYFYEGKEQKWEKGEA